MQRFLRFLLLGCGLLFCAGCDSVKLSSDNPDENVQPWARPESWEGTSRYGGMFPQSR